MISKKENLIETGKMETDLSGSIASTPYLIEGYSLVGISLNWSGTFSGSFVIQISNDTADVPTYAHDISGSVINITSGTYLGQTGFTYSIADATYRWIRVTYTSTSGTGTLTSCDLILKGE